MAWDFLKRLLDRPLIENEVVMQKTGNPIEQHVATTILAEGAKRRVEDATARHRRLAAELPTLEKRRHEVDLARRLSFATEAEFQEAQRVADECREASLTAEAEMVQAGVELTLQEELLEGLGVPAYSAHHAELLDGRNDQLLAFIEAFAPALIEYRKLRALEDQIRETFPHDGAAGKLRSRAGIPTGGGIRPFATFHTWQYLEGSDGGGEFGRLQRDALALFKGNPAAEEIINRLGILQEGERHAEKAAEKAAERERTRVQAAKVRQIEEQARDLDAKKAREAAAAATDAAEHASARQRRRVARAIHGLQPHPDDAGQVS
jgi:hypothetical protein